jgi:hypothetical protein
MMMMMMMMQLRWVVGSRDRQAGRQAGMRAGERDTDQRRMREEKGEGGGRPALLGRNARGCICGAGCGNASKIKGD